MGVHVWLLFLSLFFVTACNPAATIDGASIFFRTNDSFSSTYPLTVRGLKTNRMTFDGKNSKIFFPANDVPVIFIAPGKTLVVQNVTLVGFRPTHVELQSASSSFLFGDGVCWELESDLDFTKTMTVIGAITINGQDNVLRFANALSLRVEDNAFVEFKNCKLKGLGDFVDSQGRVASSIMCAPSARMSLHNVSSFLDSSWTFTSGSLDVGGKSVFKGIEKTFTYASGGNLTINAHASLTFTRGMIFQYASIAGRDKLRLLNETSQLFFDGATFLCGESGLTLRSGQLFLKGDVPFSTVSLDLAKGFILDDSLLTVITSNASLLVDGVVAHGQPA